MVVYACHDDSLVRIDNGERFQPNPDTHRLCQILSIDAPAINRAFPRRLDLMLHAVLVTAPRIPE